MSANCIQLDLFNDFEAQLQNSIPKITILDKIATAVKAAFSTDPNCPLIRQAIEEYTVSDRRRRKLLKGVATDAEAEAIIWKASCLAADKAKKSKRKRPNLRWNNEEI